MTNVQNTFKLSGAAALVALAVAACGGGGGGGSADNLTPSPTPTLQLADLAVTVNDTLASPFLIGDGGGGWGGDGGSDSGSADGAGAAGDGEFVRFSVKFPNATSTTGTLTWTVLASQYGIQGQTGTMTIVRDFASSGGVGGYKVTTGGGPKQVNFLVSTSGQVSGTLPLTINGVVKDTLFNGMRFKDVALPPAADPAQAFAEIQGIYGFAALAANAGTGSNADVSGGFLQVNADGSGRICPDAQTPAQVSSTCANGGNISLSFNDPAQRDVIKIAATDASINFGAYAVVHTFTSPAAPSDMGVSMTIDYKSVNDAGIHRTGAMYASRIPGTAIAPSSAIGAWNVANVNISNPGNSTASSTKRNIFVAIKDINGTVKVRASDPTQAQPCDPVTGMTLTSATGINGALQINDPTTSTPTYLILMDQDSAVALTPYDSANNDTSIALARRYSADPTVLSTCQPQ